MITSSVTLGGLTFEDVNYAGWSFKNLIDWWGQTDDKVDVRERPLAHGAFMSQMSLRSSRAISFTAQYVGTDQAELENALDDLALIGADGPVRMVVTTPAGSTARMVKVVRAKPEDHRARWHGVAQVDLIAEDPRRYSLEEESPWVRTSAPSGGRGIVWPLKWPLIWPGGGSDGRITLTNAGKAPAAPEFRLLGGFTSALITCVETGARIGIDRDVPEGSIVRIDTASHQVMLDEQSNISRWVRFREWETVPPGASRTFVLEMQGATAAAGLEGRVLSAWW